MPYFEVVLPIPVDEPLAFDEGAGSRVLTIERVHR